MERFYNPYIAVPLATWLLAQLIKFVQRAWRGQFDLRLLYSSGGMPSAHTAAIISLAVTAGILEGIRSPIFGLSAVFAAIVMYDSFGVRRSSGDQAVAINTILQELALKRDDLAAMKLREVFGHKPSEVWAGALLGVGVALTMTSSRWADKSNFLTTPPVGAERTVYLAIFGLVMLAAIFSQLLLSKRFVRRVPIIRTLKKFMGLSLMSAGSLGLLLVAGQYQSLPRLEWRIWTLLLLTVVVGLYLYLSVTWFRTIPSQYRQQLEQRRLQKKHRRR